MPWKNSGWTRNGQSRATRIAPTISASGVSGRKSRHHRGVSPPTRRQPTRSEEHTYELQSLMRISYAVFCLNKNTTKDQIKQHTPHHIPNETHKHKTHTSN